jgi:NhaP-type Na+/H+ or K+/H+ antiporter
MFEHRTEALLPWRAFVVRVICLIALAGGVVAGALGIGVVGYYALAGLPWVDALLNAAMILGGMGPVDTLHSDAAKIFASGYALFSGVVFILVAGLLLAPLFHRLMHHFHLELDEADDREKKP